jgi:DNA-binding Lrp family transcriptional regulator
MRELATSPSQFSIRRSYTDVARKLGVDEETVRNRLKMMREMGLLQGWRLIVNAKLLQMESMNMMLEFQNPESKQSALPLVEAAEGVVLIQNFYGPTMQVTRFAPADSTADDFFGEYLRGVEGVNMITHWGIHVPKCEFRPRKIDWMIIRALLANAERKLPDVAMELEISSRTVKRRVNLMMSSSAFFMQPILDLRHAMGVTPCQLLVEAEPEEKRDLDEEVRKKYERVPFRLTNSRTHSIFTILCSNVAEMKDIQAWARAHKGVRFARTDILEEQVYVRRWLEQEVDRRSTG